MRTRSAENDLGESFFSALDSFEISPDFDLVTKEQAAEMFAAVCADPTLAPTPERSIELFEKNKALAIFIVGRQCAIASNLRAYEHDDIKQTALIALAKASRKFDESKGFAFTSYAYRIIERAVRRDIFERSKIASLECCSNDAPVHGEDGSPTTHKDVQMAPSGDDPERRDLRRLLLESIDTLEPRDREIMTRYWIAGEQMSSIAAEMGISAARCSAICSQALDRLRRRMKSLLDPSQTTNRRTR